MLRKGFAASANAGRSEKTSRLQFVTNDMPDETKIMELDVWIEPVDESAMPYLVDIRAIKAYADSKGVSIVDLSDEEKQRFMIPNPNYRKHRRHVLRALFPHRPRETGACPLSRT